MKCTQCGDDLFCKDPTHFGCVNPDCTKFDEDALDEMNSDHDGGPLDATNGEFYDDHTS